MVDLCKDFGKTKVVKGITTQFRRGELVSIIGPSGSGKSTFLRCLNLLEQPTSGKLIFDGVDLLGKGVNINEHRQKIGMVFQQFNLFNNMNVIRNLTMAPTTIKGMDPTESLKPDNAFGPKGEKKPIPTSYQGDRNSASLSCVP